MTVTNHERAEAALKALEPLHQEPNGGTYKSLTNLLCNILHLCDGNSFDLAINFDLALDKAKLEYADQTAQQGPFQSAYMATFDTSAGTATETFRTNSPEAALRLAQTFADDGSLTDMDIEPPAEAYCVRQITISDEQGQRVAIWQTDEYRLQLAAPKLLEALERQVEINREILDAWNNNDEPHRIVEELIEGLQRQSESASGLPPEKRHENELESVTERRRTNAGESVQRRADHRDIARASSGREDTGSMSAPRDLGRDLLQVESEVRGPGGL